MMLESCLVHPPQLRCSWACGYPPSSHSAPLHCRLPVIVVNNLALFCAGLVVAIPAGTVVISLVYAAIVDGGEHASGRR